MKSFANWALLPYSVLASVWPQPYSMTTGSTPLWMHIETRITIENASIWDEISGSSPSFPKNIEIISTAIARTRDVIFKQNFVPWKFHERNASFEPSVTSKTIITELKLRHVENRPRLANDTSIDESYSLSLATNGTGEIIAATGVGILRGLTTFSQLFYSHSQKGIYTSLAPVAITDKPKFTHRGLNLDVARHFYPPESIKHLLDTMSFNKMNKLHLHMTDSQAWPLAIPSLPDLARKGAYHETQIYTPEDISSIQHHGALRGVDVFLEIDMPGHTASIYHAYPDLIAAFNAQPAWTSYAAEPPSGTLKLNSSATRAFLDTLLGDILPRTNRYSGFLHTGGDELNAAAYSVDNTVNSSDVRIVKEHLQRFVAHNHAVLRKHGVTPIVWQEMLLEWDVKLGKDVIVQAWQGGSAVAMVASSGYRVIAGTSDFWYLDCGQGTWLDPVTERSSIPYTGCSPYQNWRLMYSYDPLGQIEPAHQQLVIGGEAHIWSEQIDHVSMDGRVWPRASAVAEVLWSGARDQDGKLRSVKYVGKRLGEMRERMVGMGVAAEVVQMPFCLMGKDQCDG